MKKTMQSTLCILLAVLCLVCVTACGSTGGEKGLWENATYTEDTTFGSGSTKLMVEIKVEENTVTFTVNTDKTTVGDALLEHGLIAGDEGEYGMYVKKVNGITADYDVNQSYWAFYVNGEYAMAGVDATAIEAGATYRLEYAK